MTPSRLKVLIVLGLCAWSVWGSLPNLFVSSQNSFFQKILPKKVLKLGLDLQGGSHLLLEIDTSEVQKTQSEHLLNSVRRVLRKKGFFYTNLKRDTEGRGLFVTIKTTSKTKNVTKAQTALMEELDGLEMEVNEQSQLHIIYSEAEKERRMKALIEQSVEIVRRRVDASGVSEPFIQRQGEKRIVLELPGVENPDQVKRLLGKTAKMSFHLVADHQGFDTLTLPQKGGGQLTILRQEEVSGEHLENAQPTYQNGQPVVSFTFDNEGGRQFGETTRDNIGSRLAIVLDNKIISAPVIQGQILSNGVISGQFSVQEANDLSILLRAGALPAPLKILEERTVGPSLGSDSIRAGKIAFTVGLICIFIFMPFTYGSIFGFVADIALAFNILFIVAILSLLQATLTLPGIAGLVLTMGMAVDANVLIFERIKEETRNGLKPFTAVTYGYQNAHSSILDANVTTLLVGLILYFMGSGPIQGFGVTLSIGILTSYFTGVYLSRLLTVFWLQRKNPKKLPF